MLWTFMYKFLCVHVFISLGYITLRRIARSFSNTLFNIPRNYQTIFKATIPRYIPISNVYGFQFLYILINICYENLTFWLQPSNCLWSSILLWFCFAFLLLLKILNIFSCAYWPWVFHLGEMSIHILCPFLKIFGLSCWIVRILYIF